MTEHLTPHSARRLVEVILALGSHIRYAAVADPSGIEMQERETLANPSSASSDFYEELLVNPTILGIAGRRGDLDCGGLRHVIVGYGRFNQVVLPTSDGHVSVAVELGVSPDSVATDLAALIERRELSPRPAAHDRS